MENKVLSLQPYLKTLTLLCVDDSPIMATIYDGLFNILFKEVIFAENAEDALDIYKKQKIDLIITEQNFTGMSGIELIKSIREKNRTIPIIFVSFFEEIDLLTEAIKYKIHNFVKKPLETTDLLEGIETATRQLLADKYLEEQKAQELNMLKNKIDYSDYQETLSFQKALKIINNDYYYKSMDNSDKSITIIDFLYNAKDVISGDSYSARKIDDDKVFLFLIDGMGKGVSASISSMMAVTSLNRRVDLCINKKNKFSLKKILKKTIKDAQKTLLDEEILSASFILFNKKDLSLEYASFSMPPILLQDKHNKISSLKSNNPPICSYINDFKINKISYKYMRKFLLYSDGLVENSLSNEEETYSKYIQEDFRYSLTREDFRQKIVQRLGKQEDDISFILVNYLDLKNQIDSKSIDTSMQEVEQTNEWFEEKISEISEDTTIQSKLSLAFNELLMNAYEHGNLGVNARQKHKLIETNEYYDYLLKEELTCNKKIDISLYITSNSNSQKYIVIKIRDEGTGFDTNMLKNIFGINKTFNQRGILMSRNSTLGIYYNDLGNQVTFIAKV